MTESYRYWQNRRDQGDFRRSSNAVGHAFYEDAATYCEFYLSYELPVATVDSQMQQVLARKAAELDKHLKGVTTVSPEGIVQLREFLAEIASGEVNENTSASASPSQIPSPDACQLCDRDKREHSLEWAEDVGYHNWVPPTSEQRKSRMVARREAH